MRILLRWAEERGDPYVVSLVRAIVGALLIYEAGERIEELATRGYFGDFFHLPLWPSAWVPGRGLYAAVLAAEVILGALAMVGIVAREALLARSLIGLYVLGCDRVQYHNNRYALVVFAFLLALCPCDARVALRPRMNATRAEPLWAQRLAQAQLGIVYLASGGSKLLDPDWRAGRVLGDRFVRYGPAAVRAGVPHAIVEWLATPGVAEALAKTAIATELSLVVLLWTTRSRPFALWWGTMFHLTIEMTARVEIFTWLTLAIYALFAVPTTRERIIACPPEKRGWSKALATLDWLRRYEHREVMTTRVELVDRDGRQHAGLRAWVLAT